MTRGVLWAAVACALVSAALADGYTDSYGDSMTLCSCLIAPCTCSLPFDRFGEFPRRACKSRPLGGHGQLSHRQIRVLDALSRVCWAWRSPTL